jgi:zinc/manganese transport system ATP-binding protein
MVAGGPNQLTAAPAGLEVIRLRDAAARVAGRDLWRGLDLSVGAGEFVAVLGPNGAGKSTLLNILLGLLPAAEGEIRVFGGRPGRARNLIGYLPQRRGFDPGLQVRGVDIVRLGLDGNRWGVPIPGLARISARRRAENRRVAEVLEIVGAAGYARRPVGRLSGGEQQRILLAQALVREPRLLLLDEPLDSLDLPNQAAIAALLAEICGRQLVTVVIVAHDVNPILRSLDRVVYLARGAAAAGRPADVITGTTLTRLYGSPIEVLHTSDGRLVVVGAPDVPAVHTDLHVGAGDAPG